MSAPGRPQCQCAHPYYYCCCQFSRWGVPTHAAPPTFHLSQYYLSTQYSATATYTTTHTHISASNFVSGPSQLPQVNSVPFPLANATASTLNTDNPSPSQPCKRRRVNATSSSDRSKKRLVLPLQLPLTSLPSHLLLLHLLSVLAPAWRCRVPLRRCLIPHAIEKVVGKVKNKADRRVMALHVWHFV